jgi:hypothetical protein
MYDLVTVQSQKLEQTIQQKDTACILLNQANRGKPLSHCPWCGKQRMSGELQESPSDVC